MSEAGEVQVHAGDRQPVGRHHVEHAPARDRRGVGIGGSLPELMRNDVWPGVWPWHGMAVTPGNTSPF